MDQLKRLLQTLSLAQKISIAVAVLVLGGAIYFLREWRHEGDFKTLFSQLSPEDASAMVQKLKESGIEYRLAANGGSLLVPAAKLAEIRLLMAGSGLPKTGRMGFELFDKTNFGATDFAEHVNYRRALEGELERSILSLGDVDQARVHITFPKESVFAESRQPAKASVMVSLRNNAQLAPANVSAITHLVASAVEGLSPQAVSVVDRRGHLLTKTVRGPEDEGATTDALLEYRQQVEQDLLRKINNTLEPVLGANRFQAGVTVECDFNTREESEEIVDPARSVMVSSQKTEETQTSSTSSSHALTGGVPGTAANLPRPTPAATDSGKGLTRRTENVAYQSSRTVRHVKAPRGEIKRISIAVMVDHDLRWEGQGDKARRVLAPPTPEKLKSIQELVANVSGLDEERGDRLTVDSLPFDATLHEEPPLTPTAPAPAKPSFKPLAWPPDERMLSGVALIIVFLGIAFWIIRQQRHAHPVEVKQPAQLPAGAAQQPVVAKLPAADTVSGEIAEQLNAANAAKAAALQKQEIQLISEFQFPTDANQRAAVLLKHISEEVKKDSQTSAQLLRSWLLEAESE